jgi:ATP-dependent DNA helicase RecG
VATAGRPFNRSLNQRLGAENDARLTATQQHRFGVFDRARLQALGPQTDMLLLTATPIPRSLARVLLSNLEVKYPALDWR